MRIVCISDTHGLHDHVQVPDGDILIHAGDHCNHGRQSEVRKFDAWLAKQPHRHKIFIAGNHDWPWQKQARYAPMWIKSGAIYLRDTAITIEGVKLYGSPWQPDFCNWAFNLPRGPLLAAKWQAIPDDTDILVTHGPPLDILDRNSGDERTGCADLAHHVGRVRPRLHVFGHIHDGYGVVELDGTTFVNACACDYEYEPVNPPIVVNLKA
jgi:predicted phosphodiesterase